MNDYYENPIDYGSLETLHLWWFRVFSRERFKTEYPGPDECDPENGSFKCLTQFLHFCEMHGFDVPDFETDVPPSAFMFRQTVSLESLPLPVREELERRQRQASE